MYIAAITNACRINLKFGRINLLNYIKQVFRKKSYKPKYKSVRMRLEAAQQLPPRDSACCLRRIPRVSDGATAVGLLEGPLISGWVIVPHPAWYCLIASSSCYCLWWSGVCLLWTTNIGLKTSTYQFFFISNRDTFLEIKHARELWRVPWASCHQTRFQSMPARVRALVLLLYLYRLVWV